MLRLMILHVSAHFRMTAHVPYLSLSLSLSLSLMISLSTYRWVVLDLQHCGRRCHRVHQMPSSRVCVPAAPCISTVPYTPPYLGYKSPSTSQQVRVLGSEHRLEKTFVASSGPNGVPSRRAAPPWCGDGFWTCGRVAVVPVGGLAIGLGLLQPVAIGGILQGDDAGSILIRRLTWIGS